LSLPIQGHVLSPADDHDVQLAVGRWIGGATNTNKSKSNAGCLVWRDMAPFDLDACIAQLLRKQLLHEVLLREICEKTKEVLMRESNVVHVSAPVTVVGDIHG